NSRVSGANQCSTSPPRTSHLRPHPRPLARLPASHHPAAARLRHPRRHRTPPTPAPLPGAGDCAFFQFFAQDRQGEETGSPGENIPRALILDVPLPPVLTEALDRNEPPPAPYRISPPRDGWLPLLQCPSEFTLRPGDPLELGVTLVGKAASL